MKILKNILLVVIALLLAYLFLPVFIKLYDYLFPRIGEGLFYVYARAADYLVAGVFAYEFFLSLLFTAFGDAKKYWWIGIGLLIYWLYGYRHSREKS